MSETCEFDAEGRKAYKARVERAKALMLSKLELPIQKETLYHEYYEWMAEFATSEMQRENPNQLLKCEDCGFYLMYRDTDDQDMSCYRCNMDYWRIKAQKLEKELAYTKMSPYEKRPNKDWANCPYNGHVDDCDCKGMGGDR